MNIQDRKLLADVYGLSHQECNKVFNLMRKMGLGIDAAAKRVIKDRK